MRRTGAFSSVRGLFPLLNLQRESAARRQMDGKRLGGIDADLFAAIVRGLAVGIHPVAEEFSLETAAQEREVDLQVAGRPVGDAADVPR